MAPDQTSGNDAGFTLIELLVSLFIFALIASTSMAFLYQTLDSKKVIETRTAQIEELRIARTMMKMDLLQLSNRQTRGTYGEVGGAAFRGGIVRGEGTFLRLVRRGVANPGGYARRPNMQYVSYALEGGRLIRRVRARLDPSAQTPVQEQVLLTGVSGLELSFLIDGRWEDRTTDEGRDKSPLPEAVSVTFTGKNFESINQLFLTLSGTGV